MGSGHIKVKKGTHHLFYMAIARHTIESVVWKGSQILYHHCTCKLEAV